MSRERRIGALIRRFICLNSSGSAANCRQTGSDAPVALTNGMVRVRREKAFSPQWVQVPPGNWFVPPGSSRSSGRGNKAAEASDVQGSSKRLCKRAGRNVSER